MWGGADLKLNEKCFRGNLFLLLSIYICIKIRVLYFCILSDPSFTISIPICFDWCVMMHNIYHGYMQYIFQIESILQLICRPIAIYCVQPPRYYCVISIQILMYQRWKPLTISVRLDFLKCVRIFISFKIANLYRKCV